jgi:D-serine deaminase-like pyridoxal phosphate-dependent protein
MIFMTLSASERAGAATASEPAGTAAASDRAGTATASEPGSAATVEIPPVTVGWASKGLWLPDVTMTAAQVGEAGWDLFDGPFTWPVMVARLSAIETNVSQMAHYCATHDVDFAPHGKTTMSPALFAAQLAAGAWAITVATPNQALAAFRFGVPRVLIANEVLDPRPLRWLARQGRDLLCYVDSPDGVRVLSDALIDGGKVRVLVEMGYAGGRTGCRSVAQAHEVARAAAAVPGVEVAGVAGFEGMLPGVFEVEGFLTTLVQAAARIAPLCPYPVLISAGGSAYFDVVVEVLAPAARAHGGRLVLRSGAVVTHDDGTYASNGGFTRVPREGTLTAALEVWAQVLATPEPDLAILGAGKRDLPYDWGLPVPLTARGIDGVLRPLPGSTVDLLNDQHAYLRGAAVQPGELVRLGISHPCTAFDKWRTIPIVDDSYRVVDVIDTYF